MYGGDRRKATGIRGSPAQRAKYQAERLLRQSPQTKAFTPTKAREALPTEIRAGPGMVLITDCVLHFDRSSDNNCVSDVSVANLCFLCVPPYVHTWVMD